MKNITELIRDVYSPDWLEEDSKIEFQETQKKSFRSVEKEVPLVTEFQVQPGDKNNSWGMILAKVHAITNVVAYTCWNNQKTLNQATDLLASWMIGHEVIRILGAGRALLAGSMPGNRLAHGGAQVSFMGGMVPMPNSIRGGGIIACSASGKTKPVLEAMEIAKSNNPRIPIIGLAKEEASVFKNFCDVFIGINFPKEKYENPLSALADTEEYVISEILDGLVVMAGKKIGFTDLSWKLGHEDIGPTGPYAPNK